MSNTKVIVGQQNAIKVRVGQQNSTKIVSSISGSAGGQSLVATNVIGGIASVTQLSVSGVSTFVGIATFRNDVYIDGDLYVTDDLKFDELIARNANVTGNLISNLFYYPNSDNSGIAYFNPSGLLVSTGSTSVAITETNYILSTNSSGIPTWSNTIDGGSY